LRREDEERRSRAHATHLIRQEREAAEQIKLRAEAAELGLKVNPNYKLIRCKVCGEIKNDSWRDGTCNDCVNAEYEASRL
jgi:hypothetical protein